MKTIFTLILISIFSCGFGVKSEPVILQDHVSTESDKRMAESCLSIRPSNFQTGAEQMDKVVSALKGKKIGLIGNPSSQVDGVHLVDTLLASGIALERIFCPEHGFRGDEAAGAHINDSVDEKTGLSIVSLHGKHKKPKLSDISDLDVLVFDIQDVGARFYTYISTLHYVMEAAAEANVPVIVLDRPNPNGHVIDGPILQEKFSSFIGMHPIPVTHGMTIGEYGQMINGEGWLEDGKTCELSVIPCDNYVHHMRYELPVKPSPNLPNAQSVYLYSSICFFEGTAVSIGRGTDTPFQMYGHPSFKGDGTTFTPKSMKSAPTPKLEGKECSGYGFNDADLELMHCNAKLNLQPLLSAYKDWSSEESFFSRPDFFDLLAGNSEFRSQITAGKTEKEIRASWEKGLEKFKETRAKYLLYQ